MFDSQEKLILGSLVIVYFFILFGISYYINWKSIRTYDDYNVAGRSVSIYPLILTFVGTAIGGSTLLGFMENGYRYGMGIQWINIGTLVAGVVLLAFFVRRIRALGERYNMITIADYTVLRFGEGARIPTVLSILVAYSAITGMQFVAIATILNLTIGTSMVVGIFASWIMLTLKTYFGGMKSVIWQDAFHGTLQTIGLVILFVVVIYTAGGWGTVKQNAINLNEQAHFSFFSSITPKDIFIYLLTIGGYQFVRQDLWQRFWAAKSAKTAMTGYWISIIVAGITGAMVIVIGVVAKYGLWLTDINPMLTYYEVINKVFSFPMVTIMIVALLATVISTADSFFMAGASSIVNDIIKPRMKNPVDSKLLSYSRLSVMLVSIFSLLLSLYIPKLVDLWVTGTAMLVSGLVIPVLVGLYWKGATKRAGVLSMWGGLLLAVVWQFSGHPLGLHPVFVGLPASIILLVAGSLIKREQGECLLQKLYD